VNTACRHAAAALAVLWLLPALLPAEDAPPWKPLFDGKFPVHFRGYKKNTFPYGAWTIRGGELHTLPGERVDLMLRERYTNFEFSVEWRIEAEGSSGIIYLLQESAGKPQDTGLKFALVDNDQNTEAKNNPDCRCGALYGLLAPSNAVPQPSGQWNESRVLVQSNRVEHWLNGQKVLEYALDGDELKAQVEKSRFKDLPDFGKADHGYIALQHNGSRAGFRNPRIRILPLPEKTETAGKPEPVPEE
jgi:hypothetical protein